MTIRLTGVVSEVTLPQGLIWSDELTYTPVAVETTFTLTGALILERALKQAGRPITLTGSRDFAWITRSDLLALQSFLGEDQDMTLTLHDARTFTVRPAADPLQVSPVPRVKDSGFANPSADAWYVLEALKLIEV